MPQRRKEEIRTLRTSGQVNEAFTLAQQSLEKATDNVWLKREIAWACYAQAKKRIEQGDIDEAIIALEFIYNLNFKLSDEPILSEQLTWLCAKIVKYYVDRYKGSVNDAEFTHNARQIIASLKHLVEILNNIQIATPSKAYSSLMNNIHRLLKDRYGYAAVFNLIGFEKFSQEDYHSFRTESGRTIPPLVEQILLAYTKALLSGFRQNSEKAKPLAEDFLLVLNGIKKTKPEYLWTDYNITRLLIALNRPGEARQYCVDFIKHKPNEFWAWECLGQINETLDASLSVSCYCMALSCKAEDDFLVSVMENAARVFASVGHYNAARTEVDRALKIRREKWNKIPISLAELSKSDWYRTASPLDDNRLFYEQYRTVAMGLVFGEQKPIVITHLNTEKKFANYITQEGKVGYFGYSRIKTRNIRENVVYLATFIKEAALGPSDVLNIKEAPQHDTYSTLRKEVCGQIKITAKGFGFIDDCFVSSQQIQKYNLTDRQNVKAVAIRSYDRKKDRLGWSVIGIMP